MKLPRISFHAQALIHLPGACAVVLLLFIGQQIILLPVLAAIVAILVNPVVHLLVRRHNSGIQAIPPAGLHVILAAVEEIPPPA